MESKRWGRKRTERPALGSLSHIPLEDILLGHAGLAEGIHGARAATAEGTNNNNPRLTAGLLGAGLQGLLDISDERGLVGVALDAGERLVSAVLELPGPGLEGERSAGETGVVAEGGNTATALVDQELEVEEGAAAAGEAGENLLPAVLLLVWRGTCQDWSSAQGQSVRGLTAMGELDVDVFKGD
ncbi:hypothetical protein VTJ49DRAFT_4109 [Mycothermus thermophilus]|uniref:Uncharacterized protein n=1 Tax=Humicola insolens TaxID=85995 RepID=A0ABR3V6M5_HUMIN